MHYWLLKSEPHTYSFNDLVREKIGHWDGVRNYQARNFLRQMQPGDQGLFYQSVQNPAVVGTLEIVKAAYPDHTAKEGDWSMVDVKPLSQFLHAVSLRDIKADSEFSDMLLLKQSRLSVMPVSAKHFRKIVSMGAKAP